MKTKKLLMAWAVVIGVTSCSNYKQLISAGYSLLTRQPQKGSAGAVLSADPKIGQVIPSALNSTTNSGTDVTNSEDTSESIEVTTDGVYDTPVVGTLTAYYAKENFKVGGTEYKKEQLICDSNDPINRIIEKDKKNYKYEGDYTGEYYTWLLPKAKVEKREYIMNQLPAAVIGKKMVFVAKDGSVAQIFLSNINGHKYYSYKNVEGGNWPLIENKSETEKHKHCYVLSAEIKTVYGKYLFEEQLENQQGYIKLYDKSRFSLVDDTSSCRYKNGVIGFIEEQWCNKEGWESEKTAYSEDGKLLVDQCEIDGLDRGEISIAYIDDLKALYISGKLYYAQSPMNTVSDDFVFQNYKEEVWVKGKDGYAYASITINIDWPHKSNTGDVSILQKEIIKLAFDQQGTDIKAAANKYIAKQGKKIKRPAKYSPTPKNPLCNDEITILKKTSKNNKYVVFSVTKNQIPEPHGSISLEMPKYYTFDIARGKMLSSQDIIKDLNANNNTLKKILLTYVDYEKKEELSEMYEEEYGRAYLDIEVYPDKEYAFFVVKAGPFDTEGMIIRVHINQIEDLLKDDSIKNLFKS